MITSKNFKKVLKKLGFEPGKNNRWSRTYNGATMIADFEKEKLIYPEAQGLLVGNETTSNFYKNENFVVFECVCRLLAKGYHPEHIELEHRWPLGGSLKSGRADILVKRGWDPAIDGEFKGTLGPNGEKWVAIIIIECKTAGDEYSKAKGRTEENGGQLFSYWQQSTSTKWLALYSSDWKDRGRDNDGDIVVVSHVIKSFDDENVLEKAEVDKTILTYNGATTAEERFNVWKNTYSDGGKVWHWFDNLIFDPDSQAYNVEIPPLRKGKLKAFAFDDKNKIVNDFEEILRHNNVSDKENAFNRLLALFICKLVDEIETQGDDEEVAFQYKYGERYVDFQDRLQELHKRGMEEFMKEKITYVKKDYAKKLFERYKGKDREEAIKDLDRTIRMLKFYSNNDFAFKEVHNEELFIQNSQILVEVVKLFEQYKIVYPKEQQVLGDLFEQLLSKGFKQNEGQFFTPTPITRFIWNALPLEKYYKEKGIPKVIDYSCGAGHFLTEAVEAINAVAQKSKNANPDNSWSEKYIFGIEKDYRLARVSKVSMFMHGSGGSNIIFGDGLENYPDKHVEEHSFDILVANPPYSVKKFKQHLDLKNNKFQLLDPKRDLIKDTGSEIETLFVERIAQLLKPEGIAAVILPVALLNKASKRSYVVAREILLQNFHIRAIVRLGNKTFAATGTNTVILFLERHKEPPCYAKLAEDCCNEIMNGGDDISYWTDQEILTEYLELQNISEGEFRRFVSRKMEMQEVKEHKYFQIYSDEFKPKPPIKKQLTKATKEEYEQIVKDQFYEFALKREKEKIYYFSLVYGQRTLVITVPTKVKAQTNFLGYKWSNRKGKEGLQLLSKGGKLCNKEDRFTRGTLAFAVKSSFLGEEDELPDDLKKHAKTYRLNDLLDFSACNFNKEISLSGKKGIPNNYQKYQTFKLNKIVRRIAENSSKIHTSDILESGTTPVVTQSRGSIIDGYTNFASPIADLPLILFGDHTCVLKYIDFKFVMGADGCVLMKTVNDDVNLKFLYYYLSSFLRKDDVTYERNYKYIEKSLIPVPPKNVQEKIVSECEEIDEKFNKCQADIDACTQKIIKVFEDFKKKYTGEQIALKYIPGIDVSKGTTNSITEESAKPGEYKVVAGGRSYAYTHNEFNREPPIITVSASGSAGYVNLWRERIFATDCNTIKCKSDVETIFLYYYLKSIQEFVYSLQEGGNQPHVYASDLENILVPKISPEEQKTILDNVANIEHHIAETREKMEGGEAMKRAVLDKYLK